MAPQGSETSLLCLKNILTCFPNVLQSSGRFLPALSPVGISVSSLTFIWFQSSPGISEMLSVFVFWVLNEVDSTASTEMGIVSKSGKNFQRLTWSFYQFWLNDLGFRVKRSALQPCWTLHEFFKSFFCSNRILSNIKLLHNILKPNHSKISFNAMVFGSRTLPIWAPPGFSHCGWMVTVANLIIAVFM